MELLNENAVKQALGDAAERAGWYTAWTIDPRVLAALERKIARLVKQVGAEHHHVGDVIKVLPAELCG